MEISKATGEYFYLPTPRHELGLVFKTRTRCPSFIHPCRLDRASTDSCSCTDSISSIHGGHPARDGLENKSQSLPLSFCGIVKPLNEEARLPYPLRVTLFNVESIHSVFQARQSLCPIIDTKLSKNIVEMVFDGGRTQVEFTRDFLVA